MKHRKNKISSQISGKCFENSIRIATTPTESYWCVNSKKKKKRVKYPTRFVFCCSTFICSNNNKNILLLTCINHVIYLIRPALKLMPPVLWYWSTTSEANVCDMARAVEPSHQNFNTFCCYATDDSEGTV